MKLLSLSRWAALAALALTIGSGFSRTAFGQTQTAQVKGQEQLLAKADAAPLATSTTVAPATTAPANSAPVPPPSSSFTWTGFYVGVNVGHGSSDGDTFVNPLPTAAIFVNLLPQTLNLDPSGSLGGGQVGYNHQFGHFVLGVEADIDAAGIQETTLVSPIIQNNNTPFPGTPQATMLLCIKTLMPFPPCVRASGSRLGISCCTARVGWRLHTSVIPRILISIRWAPSNILPTSAKRKRVGRPEAELRLLSAADLVSKGNIYGMTLAASRVSRPTQFLHFRQLLLHSRLPIRGTLPAHSSSALAPTIGSDPWLNGHTRQTAAWS